MLQEQKNNDVYAALSPWKDDIKSGTLNIAFHKLCSSSYPSSSNNYMYKQVEQQVATASRSKEYVSRTGSRAESSSFNIRKQCFICGSDIDISKFINLDSDRHRSEHKRESSSCS